MQTWMTHNAFRDVAYALSVRHLIRQCEDSLYVLRVLRGEEGADDHPVVEMWRGSEQALVVYGLIMCAALADRLGTKVHTRKHLERLSVPGELEKWPTWTGDRAMMISHRSALVRKDPGHYRKLFPHTPKDLAYLWPRIEEGEYHLYVSRADLRRITLNQRVNPFNIEIPGEETVPKIKMDDEQMTALGEILAKSKHAKAGELKAIVDAKMAETAAE